MTAQQVIDLAKTGELKQLAIKDDTEAVIGFINLGLIELYKRFPIETKEYMIQVQDGVTEYTLPADCMWVVRAFGEVAVSDNKTAVNEFPINADENPYSVNIVAWNKVQIPALAVGEYVSLIYVASPQQVTLATINDPLPIPEQMIEALLNYIGYRGHGSVDGKINAESNTHYQRFELSVNRIKKEGMFAAESVDMPYRIVDRGFV